MYIRFRGILTYTQTKILRISSVVAHIYIYSIVDRSPTHNPQSTFSGVARAKTKRDTPRISTPYNYAADAISLYIVCAWINARPRPGCGLVLAGDVAHMVPRGYMYSIDLSRVWGVVLVFPASVMDDVSASRSLCCP